MKDSKAVKTAKVYDEIREMYGFEECIGMSFEVRYLPTKRSRKWRLAFTGSEWSENRISYITELKKQEGWYAIKVIPTC